MLSSLRQLDPLLLSQDRAPSEPDFFPAAVQRSGLSLADRLQSLRDENIATINVIKTLRDDFCASVDSEGNEPLADVQKEVSVSLKDVVTESSSPKQTRVIDDDVNVEMTNLAVTSAEEAHSEVIASDEKRKGGDHGGGQAPDATNGSGTTSKREAGTKSPRTACITCVLP